MNGRFTAVTKTKVIDRFKELTKPEVASLEPHVSEQSMILLSHLDRNIWHYDCVTSPYPTLHIAGMACVLIKMPC